MDEDEASRGALGALRRLWGDLKQFAQEAGDSVSSMSVLHWLHCALGDSPPRKTDETTAAKKTTHQQQAADS
ncbi:hypothetical protein OEZ85_005795 [Tetradesmus obliquus]|uniref:Uncharacterized protein n=2 Tax=Tetradesmus obliquus TaxID=3088 RepID=A0A383WD56_TETOB|nr:hypothetical protein OEZ85_005795 [Tetradesmus obliquus]